MPESLFSFEILFRYADTAVIQNKLTEHRVCPGEPLSRILGRVVYVEALVHHALACVRRLHHLQDAQLLLLLLARQALQRQGDVPDITGLGMLAADALCAFSFLIVRICTA